MSSYSTGDEMKKIKIKVTYEGLTEKVKEDFNKLLVKGAVKNEQKDVG